MRFGKKPKEERKLEEALSKSEGSKVVEEEDILRYCIGVSKDWLQKNLDVFVVDALRRATETPPIWWQWLLLVMVGVFAGIGLGVLIAYLTFPKAPIQQPIVPPIPINVTIPR